MLTKVTYVCEKCGQMYSNEREATECENSHVKPVGIDLSHHLHYLNMVNNAQFKYPIRVRVKMENGDIVTYYYERGPAANKKSNEHESEKTATETTAIMTE